MVFFPRTIEKHLLKLWIRYIKETKPIIRSSTKIYYLKYLRKILHHLPESPFIMSTIPDAFVYLELTSKAF